MSQVGIQGGGYLPNHGHMAGGDGGQLTDAAFANPPGRSWEFWKKIGTTNWEGWYCPIIGNGTAASSTAITNAILYAIPFPCLSTMTIDRIGVYTAGFAGGGNAHLGIYYDAGGANYMYPGTLLSDAGTIPFTSAQMASISISTQVYEAYLLWLVILVQNAGNNINMVPVAGQLPILGWANSGNLYNGAHLSVAQAYGALPGTFPAGAAVGGAISSPAIFVRRSA